MSDPAASISQSVHAALESTEIWDLHTHLYPPSFGTPLGAGVEHQADGLMLWGIDELLTYHYLVAEVFRAVPATQLPYERFWGMTKQEQADHIWKHLFVEQAPLSEACRGVLTTLQAFGLDPNDSLESHRKWFAEQAPDQQIDRVMELSGVKRITMTNAVFDDDERRQWIENPRAGDDPRFEGVLRFDPLLCEWPVAARRLKEWGYDVEESLSERTVSETRRFLNEWIDRVAARYCAVSLPPSFRYPASEDDPAALAGQQALAEIVLPTCESRGLPFAMMIGATRQANPSLQAAGDSLGLSHVESVANLCRDFPNQRFLCTMLARENQHELAVTARKFGNLMVFGCWWFLNNPSLIEEITRMRVELLGPAFIPQHSDARVLEQLVYKWRHSRSCLATVLVEKYQDLAKTGWRVTEQSIQRDVKQLLEGNTSSLLA